MTEQGWTGAPAERAFAESLRLAAEDAREGGDLARATDLWRQALAKEPHAATYAALGECLLAAGNVQEGVLHLAAGVGLGHNLFKSRVSLAEALYRLGGPFHAGALWHLEEALRIESNYTRARRMLHAWVERDPALKTYLHARTVDLMNGVQPRAPLPAAAAARARRRPARSPARKGR